MDGGRDGERQLQGARYLKQLQQHPRLLPGLDPRNGVLRPLGAKVWRPPESASGLPGRPLLIWRTTTASLIPQGVSREGGGPPPLRQLNRTWELLVLLTLRELKLRYQDTALGFVWSLIK